MTIQEYIKIAVEGLPIEEFRYYKPFFVKMNCKHCIYNGYACKHPQGKDVCMEYRVERTHKEFKKPNSRYEKNV